MASSALPGDRATRVPHGEARYPRTCTVFRARRRAAGEVAARNFTALRILPRAASTRQPASVANGGRLAILLARVNKSVSRVIVRDGARTRPHSTSISLRVHGTAFAQAPATE